MSGIKDHDFLPVTGHPDDDECTYRSDGTDDTYCGMPKEAHMGDDVSAPDDELVEVVSEAIADVDAESDTAEFWELYRDQARAVLSVPALRDALARDAQVREIVERWRSTPWRHDPTTIQAIVHLYPEVASMLRDGKG